MIMDHGKNKHQPLISIAVIFQKDMIPGSAQSLVVLVISYTLYQQHSILFWLKNNKIILNISVIILLLLFYLSFFIITLLCQARPSCWTLNRRSWRVNVGGHVWMFSMLCCQISEQPALFQCWYSLIKLKLLIIVLVNWKKGEIK